MKFFLTVAFTTFLLVPNATLAQITEFNKNTITTYLNLPINYQEEVLRISKLAEDALNDNKFDVAQNLLSVSNFLSFTDKYGKDFPIDLKIFLMSNQDILTEFFEVLSIKDNQKEVAKIILDIWNTNKDNFIKYPRLVFAIAIVLDTPPPKHWPHHQVSDEILPRKFPAPNDAFNMWIQDKPRLLMPIEKLSIEELKFLVSSLATKQDRAWAQKSVSVNISNIEKLYASVTYDYSRITSKEYDWKLQDYCLKTIKEKGGICTDQSYFTAEVAKSRGVPAFIFSGSGADGMHAWTAYMVRPGNWKFDVGRYEASRFVTGYTIDPQTWEYASDHSLQSMREAFRNAKKYRINQLYTSFAISALSSNNPKKAEKYAKLAIAQDQRNVVSWNILIFTQKHLYPNSIQIRQTYEAALKAFFNYPDIDSFFRTELIEYLKSNGDENSAQKLTTSIIIKTKSQRPDVAMRFARAELEAEIKEGNIEKLNSSYKRLLNLFKNDGAMAYTGVTIPILNSLLNAKKKSETNEIIKITRAVLKPEKNSTLETNISNAEAQIAKIEQ